MRITPLNDYYNKNGNRIKVIFYQNGRYLCESYKTGERYYLSSNEIFDEKPVVVPSPPVYKEETANEIKVKSFSDVIDKAVVEAIIEETKEKPKKVIGKKKKTKLEPPAENEATINASTDGAEIFELFPEEVTDFVKTLASEKDVAKEETHSAVSTENNVAVQQQASEPDYIFPEVESENQTSEIEDNLDNNKEKKETEEEEKEETETEKTGEDFYADL